MRPGVTIALSAVDRRRLEAIVGNRNASQKHAWRAEIVLLSAGGLGTVEIMRRTGKSKTCVWRWQERFAEEGVDGLLRDKTRPSRVAPLGQEVIDRVVALTATEPPHEATHWTGAAMAEAAGISVSSVQRIWKAHGLAPHRVAMPGIAAVKNAYRIPSRSRRRPGKPHRADWLRDGSPGRPSDTGHRDTQ